MPRDDLSIDFVKRMAPLAEALDPALVLDEWINRTQNLPEEIRFLQDELAEKDRQYDRLLRDIEDRDGRIQKWIKAHGSHQPHPKEAEHRAAIDKNYGLVEQLASEKVALSERLQLILDKHLRQLDVQIKSLYDRHEPGFEDPDELPSLVRPSAANLSQSPAVARSAANPSNPITSALNSLVSNPSQPSARASLALHARTAHQGTVGVASAPVTPAASIVIANSNRAAREASTGPVSAGVGPGASAVGGPPPKRGPRSNSMLGGLPTSSIGIGLARHSSLGPGTPKGAPGVGVQRAGSAGPRTGPKSATGAGPGRRATPFSGLGRKKTAPSAIITGAGAAATVSTPKSSLSRVKRPPAKDSPSSAADSELSDAESNSGRESDAQAGSRATPNAPTPRSGPASQGSQGPTGGGATKEGSSEQTGGPSTNGGGTAGNSIGGSPSTSGGSSLKREPGAGHAVGGVGRGGHAHIRRGRGRGLSSNSHNDDAIVMEEDDAGDDRKYCICQNVSHGDMVACDNDDCPFEWFHWSCVGLKSEPTGTWYCPVCTKKRDRAANP